MHRIAATLVVCVALSGSLSPVALAADMPGRAPAYTTPSAAPSTWTGFYAGINAGYAWGHAATATEVPSGFFALPANALIYSNAASPAFNAKGFTGGLQLGYNYQVSNWVLGLETDFNAFRLKGTADTIGAPPGFFSVQSHTEVNTDWLFTLRPRIGITTGQWLFYGTGGLAVTNLKYSQTNVFSPTCGPGTCTETVSASKTKIGWTAGAGVEARLMQNWSVKAEYLYVDFGSVEATGCDNVFCTPMTHSAKLKASIARLGLNYQF